MVFEGEKVVCRGRVVERKVEEDMQVSICDMSVHAGDGRQVAGRIVAEVEHPVSGHPGHR